MSNPTPTFITSTVFYSDISIVIESFAKCYSLRAHQPDSSAQEDQTSSNTSTTSTLDLRHIDHATQQFSVEHSPHVLFILAAEDWLALHPFKVDTTSQRTCKLLSGEQHKPDPPQPPVNEQLQFNFTRNNHNFWRFRNTKRHVASRYKE